MAKISGVFVDIDDPSRIRFSVSFGDSATQGTYFATSSDLVFSNTVRTVEGAGRLTAVPPTPGTGVGTGGGTVGTPTRPAPVSNVQVTPGNGNVAVSFTPGSNGGSAVTNYSVVCTPLGGTYHQEFIADDNSTGNYELYAFDLAGLRRRSLTNNVAYDNWQPRMHPTKTSVFWIRTPAGTHDKVGVKGTLDSTLSSTATSCNILDTGTTAYTSIALPFHSYIEDELVKITGIVNNGGGSLTLTMQRAQGGTTGVAHSSGVRCAAGINGATLWSMNVDGSGLQNVLGLPPTVNDLDYYTHPEFNPGGTEVVILGKTITAAVNVVYRLSVATTPWTYLATAVSLDSTYALADPIYSNDGVSIVFTQITGGGTPSTADTIIARVDATGTLSGGYQPNYKTLWHMKGVAAASTANVNVSSAPSSIDGVTLSNGNNVLLKNQTATSQNGVYTFTSAGAALTRSTFADTGSEFVGLAVQAKAGTTNNGTKWQFSSTTAPTLGTTAISFTSLARGVEVNNISAYDPTPSIDGTWYYFIHVASGAGVWDISRIPASGGPLQTIIGDGALNSRAIPVATNQMLFHRKENIFAQFQLHKSALDGSNRVAITAATGHSTEYPSELGIPIFEVSTLPSATTVVSSGLTTSRVISGLTNDISYTCTITADNTVGSSDSVTSSHFTPSTGGASTPLVAPIHDSFNR